MAVVRPFSCVRPAAAHAAEIAALPYDVYNREEAKREVKSHPLSFLAIDRPETGFPDTADMYAPEVYAHASNGVQGVQTRLKRKDRFESK